MSERDAEVTVIDEPDLTATFMAPSISVVPTGEVSSLMSLRVQTQVAVGDGLGDYELLRRLGSGGMGEVFAARKVGGRVAEADEVALKLLSRSSPTHLYRFKREFRALAHVEHDNLVRLHELVVLAERPPFFTMELVVGRPFTAYVRAQIEPGELPSERRLRRCLRQLIAGIHHLHGAGCVHRDLKPSNAARAPVAWGQRRRGRRGLRPSRQGQPLLHRPAGSRSSKR